MGVALYLFDAKIRLRAAILEGISELIHNEGSGTLSARIQASYEATPGEYMGLACVDGRFRLFAIGETELDDDTGETIITATDAAIARLETSVTVEARGEGLTAQQAVSAAIAGTGFVIGQAADVGETADLAVYYAYTWTALQEIADAHNVRIIPYYEFSGNQIVGRKVDIEARAGHYRGRIIEAADGASGITIIRSGKPVTDAYGVGAATGTEDPPARVTIADAAWSTEAGNPADKPQGQAYIVNPAVVSGERRCLIYKDEGETDAQKLLEKTWAELLRQQEPEISGTAVAQDVEMAPGMAHKAIRLYDQVAVRARTGEMATATVIDVARDYVRADLTKFEMGQEKRNKKSLTKKVASLQRQTERTSDKGASTVNRLISADGSIIANRATIQMNSEHIQMNARDILANAEEITLRATKEEVETLDGRVGSAEAEIEIQAGQIAERATFEDLSGLETDVGEEIDAINGKLTEYAKTTDVDGRFNEIGQQFDALEGTLTQYAKTTDLEGLETSIGQQFDALEGTLTAYAKTEVVEGQFQEVSLVLDAKANTAYVNAEITAVQNLIADEINAVSGDIDSLNAKVSSISLGIAQQIVTESLSVTGSAILHDMSLGGRPVSQTTIPVVTSFTQASGEQAETEDVTLLHVGTIETTVHDVAAGETKTFSA